MKKEFSIPVYKDDGLGPLNKLDNKKPLYTLIVKDMETGLVTGIGITGAILYHLEKGEERAKQGMIDNILMGIKILKRGLKP